MMLHKISCTILNSDYSPLHIKTARRGLHLYLKGKASIVETHPSLTVNVGGTEMAIPTQVAMKYYVKTTLLHRKTAQLNRTNLLLRDKFTCLYCNRHKTQLSRNEILTRDHVVPVSRGGQNIWTNVVTACSTCNNKKGNQTNEQAGLMLKRSPTAPTIWEILQRKQALKYTE